MIKTNEQLAHKNSACEQSTRRKSNGTQYRDVEFPRNRRRSNKSVRFS